MKTRAKSKSTGKPVLGWREWVGLPEFGIEGIKAKLDTGARTSALHAFKVHPFEEAGRRRVRFFVHPVQRHRRPEVECVADVLDERRVVSSSGHAELRFVISTDIKIGESVWPIELTLTDRDEMSFRMLLGRQALRRRVVVDPGRSFRAGGIKRGADAGKIRVRSS